MEGKLSLLEELEIVGDIGDAGLLEGGKICWDGNSKTNSPLLSDPVHVTEVCRKRGKTLTDTHSTNVCEAPTKC